MRIVVALLGLFALAAAYPSRIVDNWEIWHLERPDSDLDGIETFERVCLITRPDGSVLKECCEGWQGSVEGGCLTPVCSDPCFNGGLCIAPDTCQCLKGFTGTTCRDITKGYGWTQWMSRDNVGTGGDDERLRFLREQYSVCEGVVPSAIECRTSSGIPAANEGQILECQRRLGLVCEQDDQPNRENCLNYEVRLLCPNNQKNTLRTCTFNQLEYDVNEVRTEGSCVECTCGGDGEWDCHQKEDPNCGIPLKPTVVPFTNTFNLAKVSTNGKCYFNNKEYQASERAVELECEICTCDAINGWQCNPKPTCTLRPQTPTCKVEKHFIFFHGYTARKGCNTCVCNSGNWQCTKMICPEPESTHLEKVCYKPEGNDKRPMKEGTVVEKECNTCVCTRGKWDCTEHTCEDFPVSNPKSCVDVDNKPYPHGTTVTKDCNACTCRNGVFKCTHRFCSPNLYHNSTCVDKITGTALKTGQTTKHGCNICVCNSGNLTCTDEQCPKTSICFDELNRYDVTNHLIGVQYRPQCNQEGTFAAIQCNEFTEVCFCVTPIGRVIPGSRVYRKTPDCPPYSMVPHGIPEPNAVPLPQLDRLPSGDFPECIDYPEVTLDIPEYFQPKCLEDGSFSPLQCNPNTGICYCVSPKGATIPGTTIHVTEGVPTCKRFADPSQVPSSLTPVLTHCEDRRQVALLFKLPYVPQCDSVTNEYKPRQCNKKSNQCVCVDRNGVILKDTFHGRNVPSICEQYRNYMLAGSEGVLPFTVPTKNSQGIYNRVDFTVDMKELRKQTTSRCRQQIRIAETIKTVYTPQCESTDSFAPMQCPVSTGVCFCVDVTGAIVPDTMQPNSGIILPQCEQYRNVILAPHNLTRTAEFSSITEDIKVGAQVTKPRTSYKNKNITVPSCIRQQQIATVVPGVFYPTCQHNGTFHPQQCEPISNSCFCVDRNGVPIEGTERGNFELLPECTQYWNVTQKVSGTHVIALVLSKDTEEETQRIRERSLNIPGTTVNNNCTKQVELASLIPGIPVPTCEPDSTYTPLQCNATTGVCYCSEPNGKVVSETVTPIVFGTPSCWYLRNSTLQSQVEHVTPEENKPRYTACLRKQRIFNQTSEYERFFLTYPECMEDGSFNPIQCNKLRGFCFCVHPIMGDKFEHTETISVPDCSFFEENTCEWKGEKFYIGQQFYQDCNHCTCNGNNQAMCTRMGCDPTMCYANGQPFNNGAVAKKECNDCTCEDGNWRCTNNPCPIEVPTVELSPEPSFEQGCLRHGTYYPKDTNFCDKCNECTCLGGDWATCQQTECIHFLCYHDCNTYYDGDEIYIDNVKHRCDNVLEKFVKVECTTEDGLIVQTGGRYYKECNECICREGGEFECERNQC